MIFAKGEELPDRRRQVRIKYGRDPSAYTADILKDLANGEIIDPNRYCRLDVRSDGARSGQNRDGASES